MQVPAHDHNPHNIWSMIQVHIPPRIPYQLDRWCSSAHRYTTSATPPDQQDPFTRAANEFRKSAQLRSRPSLDPNLGPEAPGATQLGCSAADWARTQARGYREGHVLVDISQGWGRDPSEHSDKGSWSSLFNLTMDAIPYFCWNVVGSQRNYDPDHLIWDLNATMI